MILYYNKIGIVRYYIYSYLFYIKLVFVMGEKFYLESIFDLVFFKVCWYVFESNVLKKKIIFESLL